jgi:hypothetical protein
MTGYTWVLNLYQIDILISKNNHLTNRIIAGMEDSNDIEYIRNQAISILEIRNERINELNEKAIMEAKILFIVFFSLIVILVLTIIEYRKRRTFNAL